ncbi:MAG: hypothetical protein ACK4FZ_05565 [Vogesella sp.]|uniref:hypothetical protein n=1 Tax=Vogesella sp. TaxID=1904252 RepID=UPI00391AF51F
MTIQTLTSKPDGLPDVADLARLANAFFSALPGETPPDTGSLTPPSPAAAPAIQPLPASAPAPAAGSGLRDDAAYAVPQGYAAAMPQLAAAQPSAPSAGGAPASSPYYFVSEAGRYGELAGSTQAAPLPGVDDRVTAQSFGLPGEDFLRSLLLAASRQRRPARPPPPPASTTFWNR